MKKITEVTITKLFGYEGNDYTVRFFLEEPVTFIYGFNGIGKTTFFRLLDAALTPKFMVLDTILFESIIVKFSQGDTLIIKRPIIKRFDEITIEEMRQALKDNDRFFYPFVYELQMGDGTVYEGKFYFKDNWNKWLNESDLKSVLSDGPVKSQDFVNEHPVEESKHDSQRAIENLLIRIRVDLLHANKDYNRKPVPLSQNGNNRDILYYTMFENYDKLDVFFYPLEEVREKVAETDKRNPYESFDPDFFLFNNPSSLDNKEKFVCFEIPDKIEYVKKRIKDIKGIDQNMSLFQLSESVWYDRCRLFKEVINKKSGLTDKYLDITQEGDIIITLLYKNEEYPLNITDLSSGEKNLLLLYFYLIFELPATFPESGIRLQLIDEPEVSMHPDWLLDFVDNLQFINKELGRGDNFQFILATHSLAITYDHNEMMSAMRRKNG